MEPPVVAKRINRNTVLLGSLILVAILVMILLALKQNQDIRNKAAVQNGPAQLIMTPGSSNVTAGSSFSITLSANTQNLPLDGIQVVVQFSGSVPTNLTFTQTVPTGLKLVRGILRQDSKTTIHELLYTTPDPGSQPFRAESIIPLGIYIGTAPQAGTMTVTFDTNLSKILQNGQVKDILRFPNNQTYAFVPGPTPIVNNFTIQAMLHNADGSETVFPSINAVGIIRFEEADGSQTTPRIDYSSCMSGGLLSLPIAPGGTPCNRFAPGRYATQWRKTVNVRGFTYTLISPTTCSNKSCSIREQSEMIMGGQPIHRGIYQAPAPKPTKAPRRK